MIALSLVIVTWKEARWLESCLESVFSQRTPHPFEVILVANGSPDHARLAAQRFPQVRTIINRANRGVARSRNQGISLSRGRIVMMLDDDAIMHPGCVEGVIHAMDQYPDAWGGGTKTFTPLGTLEPSARTFYTIPTILFRRTPLGKWFPDASVLRKHLMTDWDHADPRPVDWVSGASLVMKREAIEAIGTFDESYFFGFEDVDWCYRVKLAGKMIYYLPQASIVHHVRAASRSLLSAHAWHHLMSFIHFSRKYRLHALRS